MRLAGRMFASYALLLALWGRPIRPNAIRLPSGTTFYHCYWYDPVTGARWPFVGNGPLR